MIRREKIPTLFTQQSETEEMMFHGGGLLKLVSEEDIVMENENESGIEQIKIKGEKIKLTPKEDVKVKKAFSNNSKSSVQKSEEEKEERKRSKSQGKGKKARSKSRGKSVDGDDDGERKLKRKKSRPLGKRVSDTKSSSKSRKSTPSKKKPEWDDRW